MGVDQLTEDPSSSGKKDPVFLKSSANDIKVTIPGVERPWLFEAEGFILQNHDTGRILPTESQRNTTDPLVADFLATDYDSVDQSSVYSTPLLPLKKLDGSEPISGPKTIKLILRSKFTFKAEALKGVITNEPSLALAKDNKNSSALKVHSALQLQNVLQDKFKRSCELCGLNNHLSENCYKVMFSKKEYLENSSNAITPDLPTKEPDNSLCMRDEHLSTILEMESDEVIKYSVENLVPIPSESEGIFDDTCDVPFCDNSLPLDVLNYQFELFSSFNDDCSSSDDDSFEDIDYVEASPLDSKLVSLEEVKDDILRKKLLNINHLIAKIEALNNNPTPNCVFKTPFLFPIPVEDSDSFFEKSDTSLSYSDNSLPKFETFSDRTKETSSGSATTHADNSLPERNPFEQRNEPPAQPRVVYAPILDLNYFCHFLDILENYNPMDDEPMWAADRVVAPLLVPQSPFLKPQTNSPLMYKEFQSRSKQPNSDHNDDDTPMSREEEAKFMQTFCRTRLYNDYRDRDSNRDNWRSRMPNYGKFLKELVSNKHKHEQISTSNESFALIQNKVPPKLRDPRSLLIPCNFNKTLSCDALAELGASINIMRYSLYAKLSLKTLKPTKMSVRLADIPFQYPVGIVESMLVDVCKFTFPVDFVILKMEEDNNVPLILGRPFLHTDDAVIQKQLNLRVGTERMTFHMDSAMKHSYSNDDTCFSINVIDEILEEDSDAFLDEGSKILHSIEGTILKEKLFAEFDVFMVMTAEENSKSEFDTEEPSFGNITLTLIIRSRHLLKNHLWILNSNLFLVGEYASIIVNSMKQPQKTISLCNLQIKCKKYSQEINTSVSLMIFPEISKFQSILRTKKKQHSLALSEHTLTESVEVFLDDFFVFGNSFDRYLKNLDKILQHCKDANLVLKWEKC
nr:reverse transcriptase domain-containing protein [Tanacetum cinerariifolium]